MKSQNMTSIILIGIIIQIYQERNNNLFLVLVILTFKSRFLLIFLSTFS